MSFEDRAVFSHNTGAVLTYRGGETTLNDVLPTDLATVDFPTAASTAVPAVTITGSDGSDTLFERDGPLVLEGGAYNDSLTGDLGEDSFQFNLGDGDDTITDFEIGLDMIDLSATGLAFGDLSFFQSGTATTVDYTDGTILLVGTTVVELNEDQFDFGI